MTLSLLKRKSNEILICSWSILCSWNFNKQTKTVFFGLVFTFKHKEQFWLLVVYFPSRQCLRVGPWKANMELYVPQSGPKSAGKVARARLKKTSYKNMNDKFYCCVTYTLYNIHGVVSVLFNFWKFKKKTNGELNNFKGCLNS